ncbi:MAG: hypothetical protein V8S72_05045 [Oscillospiraceae bacterium]
MWTKDYSELTDELPAELEHFPPIDTAAVTEYANRLFTPYLFIRHNAKRRATELQCSLCGAEMTIYDDSIPPKAYDAVYAGHNEGAICPACGELVTAKHIGKLGRRKGLAEWHPLLILTERDGEIYARGYWMRKLYIAAHGKAGVYADELLSLRARPGGDIRGILRTHSAGGADRRL